MGGKGFSLAELASEEVLDAPVPSIVRGSAPLALVVPNPLNPRQELGDVDALAQALREVGQLQPITVVHAAAYLKQYPEHADRVGVAEYVAVTGGRRHAAITSLGWSSIDITVKDTLAESRAKLLAAALMENVDRADLNPMDEAGAVCRLAEELGGAGQAAAQLGKSRQWASQRIGLLRLTPDLQALVRSGDMPVRVARQVAALPVDEQWEAWEAESIKGDTAVSPPPGSGGGGVHAEASAIPSQRPPAMQRAVWRLGKTPSDMAKTLRAHLSHEQLQELLEALAGGH